ncbi:MAG: hypothetical protein IKZ14_08920 [Muribaculaceae bacterium]|nr:hypothetical protein [Muribaculaceae bacterium]
MKIDKFFLFILICTISFQAFSDEHISDSGDVDINALIDSTSTTELIIKFHEMEVLLDIPTHLKFVIDKQSYEEGNYTIVSFSDGSFIAVLKGALLTFMPNFNAIPDTVHTQDRKTICWRNGTNYWRKDIMNEVVIYCWTTSLSQRETLDKILDNVIIKREL